MTCQNSSGLSLTRPNTTGSEPMGSKVADTKDTTNTVPRLYCGKASRVIRWAIQSCISPPV